MKIIPVNHQAEGGKVACDILVEKLAAGAQVLGLATGSSPLTFYEEIVRRGLDLSAVTSVNLDEYVGLPESDPQSYRYFMEQALFKHRPMKANYLPDGLAEDLEEGAKAYDAILDQYPIDLQILGIGRNGHIGFNEPGTPFTQTTHVVDLAPSTIKANARFFEKEEDVPRQAVSMGLASIMAAKSIIVLAYGEAKAEAVAGMLTGPVTEALPASILQEHPEVYVIADQAALSLYSAQENKN